MEEIWKDIKDYEGLYQVSNLGRVRNSRTGRLLKLEISTKGYLQVTLCKNGICKNFKVHRLVAEAFKPNPHNYPTVDHINRIRTDNKEENLRWAPYKLQRDNTTIPNLKIILQYTKDMVFVEEYLSIHEASNKTGINVGNICQCCKGKLKTAGGYVWRYKD